MGNRSGWPDDEKIVNSEPQSDPDVRKRIRCPPEPDREQNSGRQRSFHFARLGMNPVALVFSRYTDVRAVK